MLLPASSSFIRIISTFQGPAKIFSVELVLSDHCYKGLSSFSAQTLPASHILPFAALLAHIWGGASPLPPCVSPPARGASVHVAALASCRCPESKRGRSFNPIFAAQHFLTTNCASRLVLGVEVRRINAITSGSLGRPKSCKW